MLDLKNLNLNTKNKMLISHEVPLCLLEESLNFNDYQYVLPHHIDLYPKYKEFILEYRKQPNSFIICDSGLHEGINHTEQDLIEKINLIQPDIFIVPDVFHDSAQTYAKAKYWKNVIESQLPEKTSLMAVIQATNITEAVKLYDNLNSLLGYTHIAFNYSSLMYQSLFKDEYPIFSKEIKLMRQAQGRLKFIDTIEKIGILNKNIYHHLLGCSLPTEFQHYKDKLYIKSLDTSNPIIWGCEWGMYDDRIYKPKWKIDDLMEVKFSKTELEHIKYNIKQFKELIYV